MNTTAKKYYNRYAHLSIPMLKWHRHDAQNKIELAEAEYPMGVEEAKRQSDRKLAVCTLLKEKE